MRVFNNEILKSLKNKIRKKKVCLCVTIVIFTGIFCGCSDDTEDVVLSLDSVEEYSEILESVTEETVTGEECDQSTQEVQKDIYVHICGAVNEPNVYSVSEGTRLYELVEMAGGFTLEADETGINMARVLIDGEQIIIYTKEELTEYREQQMEQYINGSGSNVSTEAASGLVNINTASVDELTTITGIGESRAQAIVDYRNTNGRFTTIEDIKKVTGIKEGLFAKIKDQITV